MSEETRYILQNKVLMEQIEKSQQTYNSRSKARFTEGDILAALVSSLKQHCVSEDVVTNVLNEVVHE